MEKTKSEILKIVHKKGREKFRRLGLLTNIIRHTNETPPKNWLNLSVDEQIEFQRKLGKVDNPFTLLKGEYEWPGSPTDELELLED